MNESSLECLQFLAHSDNRVTVLATLASGPSTRPELQAETGIPRATLSRILAELEQRQLVARTGHRCEMTPLGRVLAGRLHSLFDSIEAMQRLQTLLRQLSDADSDVAFTDQTTGEILTPTSQDPAAPTRRLADLLQAASHVHLLVPSVVPLLFEVASVLVDGEQTFEVVLPRAALGMIGGDSTASRKLRDVTASGNATLFVYDGDVPYFAGAIDDLAVVGLIGGAGNVRGYIETADEAIRSSTEAIVEAYKRDAGRVNTEDLAG